MKLSILVENVTAMLLLFLPANHFINASQFILWLVDPLNIILIIVPYCTSQKMADASLIFIGVTIGFVVFWALAAYFLSSYVKSRTQNEDDKPLYGRMTISYVSLAVVMMYIMWACCYLHQLHPLIIPDLEKKIGEELLESEREDLIL